MNLPEKFWQPGDHFLAQPWMGDCWTALPFQAVDLSAMFIVTAGLFDILVNVTEMWLEAPGGYRIAVIRGQINSCLLKQYPELGWWPVDSKFSVSLKVLNMKILTWYCSKGPTTWWWQRCLDPYLQLVSCRHMNAPRKCNASPRGYTTPARHQTQKKCHRLCKFDYHHLQYCNQAFFHLE